MARIDNLGDYNKAREELQEHGGNWESLRNEIYSDGYNSGRQDGAIEGIKFSLIALGLYKVIQLVWNFVVNKYRQFKQNKLDDKFKEICNEESENLSEDENSVEE